MSSAYRKFRRRLRKKAIKKVFFLKHLSNVVLDFQHKKKMRATFECPVPVKNPAKVNDFTEDDLK